MDLIDWLLEMTNSTSAQTQLLSAEMEHNFTPFTSGNTFLRLSLIQSRRQKMEGMG
jgi:hypothetical protein